MSSVSSIATSLSGIQSNAARFEESARKIATPANPEPRVEDKVTLKGSARNEVDLPREITSQISSRTGVEANVKAIKSQDRLVGKVIDIVT